MAASGAPAWHGGSDEAGVLCAAEMVTERLNDREETLSLILGLANLASGLADGLAYVLGQPVSAVLESCGRAVNGEKPHETT